MKKRYALALAATLAALVSCTGCGGGGGGSDPAPTPAPLVETKAPPAVVKSGDLLRVLVLDAHSNPTWAASTSLVEKKQGERWSPYVWASNAAALPSIQSDPARTDATAQALLAELRKYTEGTGDGRVIGYDYDYEFTKYTLRAPWRSAFANAAAAIGLMHIKDSAPHLVTGAMIESYLAPIWPKLSFPDEAGYRWFTEYIDEELPGGRVDVINGHFFVVVAMYEWKLRTGTTDYDAAIKAGLDTMQMALPEMIQNGYFSYARGFPEIPDYGQQRAVNFAGAACELRPTICPIAARYRELYAKWTTGSNP
jgi:hypothetical protein